MGAQIKRESKAWIFVSHSTRDLEAVRRVRDHLEARGAEPLLFFLKALDQAEELRTLLRREIEARSFFLLCDTENARASRWVKEEHEYVRSLTGKRVTTIELASHWHYQVNALDEMLKTATVFLSYVRADWKKVEPYATFLADADFAVWTDTQLQAPQDWRAEILQTLRQAADDGYLIAFISANSLRSQWVTVEIEAFQQIVSGGGRLILVDLEPVDHLVPTQLQALQRLKFHAHDDATNRRRLLMALGL